MKPKARAAYAIVEDDFMQDDPLVIKDAGGDHIKVPTVTNDAAAVVRDLVAQGHLPPGRRLLYYDSEGDLGEILIRGNQFAGFRPVGEMDP